MSRTLGKWRQFGKNLDRNERNLLIAAILEPHRCLSPYMLEPCVGPTGIPLLEIKVKDSTCALLREAATLAESTMICAYFSCALLVIGKYNLVTKVNFAKDPQMSSLLARSTLFMIHTYSQFPLKSTMSPVLGDPEMPLHRSASRGTRSRRFRKPSAQQQCHSCRCICLRMFPQAPAHQNVC